VAVVRIVEEDRRLSQVSRATLSYMYEYGVNLENRLRWHRGNLRFYADEEYDLVEAMRLAGRLTNVGKNIARAGRRNERMRAEIVRREAERRDP
jgi:hypothetical protein